MIKNRKHKSDLVILFATLGLMALGLIVIYAIGPRRADVLNNTYGTDYDSNYFFFGQLRAVVLSVLAFFAAFKWIPYKYVKKYAKVLLIISLALCIALWVLAELGSGLAKCELGECRWFQLGPVSFQPAEFLKLAMVIYLADFLARKKEEGNIGKLREFWLPLSIVCGLALFLAQSLGGRVANTCNLSEDYVGYSTRYGDSVGDFSPLSRLTVAEVKEIGHLLGLPHHLVEKVPIDGLCGKTDEDNLGFTYAELDRYIRTGVLEDEAKRARIDRLHEMNKFKLELMPCFEPTL